MIDGRIGGQDHREPRIVAFICNWGAYTAAEMAGTGRRQYAPNVRLVRLMCLGQLRASQVINAFELGADGVILLACPPSDCHYGFGSHRSEEAFREAQELIQILGLEEDRLRLEWVLPGDASHFARTLNAFSAVLGRLGRSPLVAEAPARGG